MELKPGYKQTEAGVIPEDWELQPLKQLISIKSGVAFSSRYFSDKGPTLLTPGNFKLGGGLYFSERNTKHYSGPYSSSMLFCYGDLLIVMTDLTPDCNLLGKPAFVRLREPILHNQRIGKVVLIGTGISTGFLYWFFLSDAHAVRMKATATGSTVRHTSNGSIYGSQLAFPPTIAEQEAIAETLSDAEGLIESLEQLLAKKRNLKQGAMQELLAGSRRLPGFGGEWQQKKLGELGESLIGLTYKPSNVKSDGLLVLRSSNIFQEALRLEDNVFVDMDVPAAIILRKGDILICVRNGSRDLIGKCALISEEAQGMTFGAFMAVFRTTFYDFVYHQFQSNVIKRQINEHLGATINQITNKSLNSFQVPFPTDEEERAAIAEILNDMNAEIVAAEGKLAKARQLKRGMMQELLTGRTRLV